MFQIDTKVYISLSPSLISAIYIFIFIGMFYASGVHRHVSLGSCVYFYGVKSGYDGVMGRVHLLLWVGWGVYSPGSMSTKGANTVIM